MKRHEHPGLFIAVEGLDGSGSSIQSTLLAGVLEKEGYRVVLTKEPTTNLIGGLIRAQLSKEWEAAGPDTLQILFTADRAHHLHREILPALEAGKIVISDRYAFSSIAYGSIDVKDQEWLKQLNAQFILPDLTFLIQVRPKICAIRMKESHYEVELYDEEQKLTKVWNAYETLAKIYSGVHTIHGERGELEILHEMKELVLRALVGGKRSPSADKE
ncbi:MAG: dTMP kinase [Patescibacteria group bacterium]